MGLTRQQKSEFASKEAEKYRKYNALMKDRWAQLEIEWLARARTMEMMLEANYDRRRNVFVKAGGPDTPDRWFDCKGVELFDDWDVEAQQYRRPW